MFRKPLILPKTESWKMFDEISPRYDFLNHLLSFGLNIYWRNQLVRFLPKRQGLKVLDLATGTAEVILTLVQKNKNVQFGYGIDLAEKMLALGRKKIAHKGLSHQIILKKDDINQISFEADSFDCATIAFGIRNVEDPCLVLKEMYRVLRKEGRALILEFSLPFNPILRGIYLCYLRTIVPLLGFIFSKHKKAYRYLNQTIESFPYGDQFCTLMKESGFKNVKTNPLTFGIASIYQGEK